MISREVRLSRSCGTQLSEHHLSAGSWECEELQTRPDAETREAQQSHPGAEEREAQQLRTGLRAVLGSLVCRTAAMSGRT